MDLDLYGVYNFRQEIDIERPYIYWYLKAIMIAEEAKDIERFDDVYFIEASASSECDGKKCIDWTVKGRYL